MKRCLILVVVVVLFCVGCDGFRFAPNEAVKQNAWLHNRAAAMTAEMVRDEGATEPLADLAKLCEIQSRAFVADYGLPDEFPPADSVEDILAESSRALAGAAFVGSAKRPDVWDIAEGAMDLGIGLAALFGGVYGVRAARFLRDARTKSKALREIIQGNEIFKRSNADSATAFKTAHRDQSPKTRQIVAEMKS